MVMIRHIEEIENNNYVIRINKVSTITYFYVVLPNNY